MEKHRCKLCHRRFANGRALGGHMRSHAMLSYSTTQASAHQPPPPVPVHHQHHQYPLQSPSASSSSFSTPAAAAEEKTAPTYGLRENPRKSFRLADAEFSASFAAAAGSSSIVQDGESDAESSLRRPKRLHDCTSQFAGGETEPLTSSISDASPEEDVARSLVLLSRDSWSRFGSPEERTSNERYEREGDNGDAEEEEDDDDDDDDDERGEAASRLRQRKRTKYQCGNCRKVFRSYQALGGHRASHKRVGVECMATTTDARAQIHSSLKSIANASGHETKIFQCPYCHRAFSSGQALGGHKRSHFARSAAITGTSTPFLPPPAVHSPLIVTANSSIDLNLPAPLEEEVELSAVSVATDFPSKLQLLTVSTAH